jgi:uncharacterized repeat protein (TIGR03803 family)
MAIFSVLIFLSTGASLPARAQVESVLHKFGSTTGDGRYPQATLVRDSAGNLYGTTEFGGSFTCGYFHCGTVFEMVFDSATNSYSEKVLYEFQGGTSDGSDPFAPLVMDSAGNLYGTTEGGGPSPNCNGGCGTVFELVFDSGTKTYTEKVLHYFAGGADGYFPIGGLAIDSGGNLYGTTSEGGPSANTGTVFELALDSATNTYAMNLLYPFSNVTGDGSDPQATLIRDSAGNLYGTTHNGGLSGGGTVFELVFDPGSNTYTEKILYNFAYGTGDGGYPHGDLARDPVTGNLFGTTERGGSSDEGIAYELAFDSGTDTYTEKVLHDFTTGTTDGYIPEGGLLRDSSGNLFGTTEAGGSSTNCYGGGCGTVFELAYDSGTDTYTEKVLYSFTAENNGLDPLAGLLRDSAGNLFGTASGGSSSYVGNLFGIAPVTRSSASLDFGNVPEDATSSPQTVTLTNNGSGNLQFGTASFSGTNATDFSVGTTDSCSGQTVAANGSCSVSVTFSPSSIGSESATLTLAESGLPVTVSLTGTGTTGGVITASLEPASLTFPGQLAGTPGPAQTVTLTNTSASNVSLRIDSINVTSNFTETTNCGVSLAQGNSCTISVAFAPTTTGDLTGTLTVQDNASTGNGQQTVALSGTGLAPAQFIQDVMVSQVEALGLNNGQTNSLVKELQKAASMISVGKINGAIGNLETFIAEVNDLASSGVLSAQEASFLIGEAINVINALG